MKRIQPVHASDVRRHRGSVSLLRPPRSVKRNQTRKLPNSKGKSTPLLPHYKPLERRSQGIRYRHYKTSRGPVPFQFGQTCLPSRQRIGRIPLLLGKPSAIGEGKSYRDMPPKEEERVPIQTPNRSISWSSQG